MELIFLCGHERQEQPLIPAYSWASVLLRDGLVLLLGLGLLLWDMSTLTEPQSWTRSLGDCSK